MNDLKPYVPCELFKNMFAVDQRWVLKTAVDQRWVLKTKGL